jgi:hypothetical protein
MLRGGGGGGRCPRELRLKTLQLKTCCPAPQSVPDYESAGAAWASPEEIASLRLRGPEPLKWCRCVPPSLRMPLPRPLR